MFKSFSRIVSLSRYSVMSLRCDMELNEPGRITETVLLDASCLAAIEASRPGYARVAARYLMEGDQGFGVVENDRIVAMGWLRVNSSEQALRVKSYFPLPPNSAYLHGDWTAPSHRGRGLQPSLVVSRVKSARSSRVEDILVNMSPANRPSLHNYKRLGFLTISALWVIHVGRLCYALPSGASSR